MVLLQIEIKFDWDKMKQENFNSRRLTVPGLILLILYIGPIRGRTKLQKEVFLAWHEVFGEYFAIDPIFHPDQFGPYSQLVVDTQAFLKSKNEIRVISRGEGHQTFVISEKGKSTLKKELVHSDMPEKLIRTLKEKKTDWDEWTAKGIMRYIYRNYPYYGIKARIKELKWE
jgi:uncharacterized protein YwgA